LADKTDIESDIGKDFLKHPLMPHQKVTIEFLLKRKAALNGSEMGTGKTLPAIVAALHLKNTGKIKNCLIVCIASVKWNWEEEIKKFIKDTSVQVVEGTREKRIEQYMSKAFFKIVNYEILRNDINAILYDAEYDCIIVDEIHRIRNYKSLQTKALLKLGKTAKYRFGLTGTPLQNKLNDLYSIMKFIHPHLLGNWMYFSNRYLVKGFWGSTVGYKKLDEINDKLKMVMIRKMKKDVLKDLPPKTYNNIYVKLDTEQRKFYNDVRNKLLKSLNEDVERKIKQANILANITYLREVCDSCELIDPNIKSSSKLRELETIVKELLDGGHKVVIFSQFKKMIKIVEQKLKFEAITLHGDISTTGGVRQKLVNEFASSKTKNLFLMTTAGGEGINLQCADYMIFIDLPFNPQVIAQIEDRLHRKGQTKKVNIIRLIAIDTIEDRILEILNFKQKLFKEVVDGIKPTQQKINDISITQDEILRAIKEGKNHS